MTDHPIIFSAPMVRALLDGRKTQTRRLISTKGQANLFNGNWTDEYVLHHENDEWRARHVQFAPGDRLYVREAFRGDKGYDACPPSGWSHWPVHYEADGIPDLREGMGADGRMRPSIHMPRWASRLTLTVTNVRVQRLQEISEADAVAEGVEPLHTGYFPYGLRTFMTTVVDGREVPAQCCRTASHSFQMLWNSLHGPDAWAANPWVVALSFTVQQGNIDQIGGAA